MIHSSQFSNLSLFCTIISYFFSTKSRLTRNVSIVPFFQKSFCSFLLYVSSRVICGLNAMTSKWGKEEECVMGKGGRNWRGKFWNARRAKKNPGKIKGLHDSSAKIGFHYGIFSLRETGCDNFWIKIETPLSLSAWLEKSADLGLHFRFFWARKKKENKFASSFSPMMDDEKKRKKKEGPEIFLHL